MRNLTCYNSIQPIQPNTVLVPMLDLITKFDESSPRNAPILVLTLLATIRSLKAVANLLQTADDNERKRLCSLGNIVDPLINEKI